MNSKVDNLKSYILYFLMYCPLGFVCPMVGQYCTSIGFSGTQVGIVTSVGTLGSVLGGMVWGKIFANANKKRFVVISMFLCAALMSFTALYIKVFILFAFIYGALYFFQGPSHGLCDHMIIAKGGNFPLIRAMGAIGYAVASLIAGILAERFEIKIVFIMGAVFYIFSSIIMYSEKEPPHYSDHENKAKISELFKDRGFIKLLICAFFTLGTTMANNTYFSYLYIEAGGDLSGVGFCFLLLAGSEAAFMFILPKIEKKLPIEKIITIGIITSILRFALYSFGLSKELLIGTFFLQGIMNGILLVEMVKYFGQIVEPRLSSLSVSTYYSLGNSFSAIVCNFIGGMMLDGYGAKGVYAFFVLFNIIGLVLYIAMGLNKVQSSCHNEE